MLLQKMEEYFILYSFLLLSEEIRWIENFLWEAVDYEILFIGFISEM